MPKKILATIVAILSLVISIYISTNNPAHTNKSGDVNQQIELNGPYKIERIVDGDTIVIKLNKKNVKLRLIGVNTPESVHDNMDKNTAEGKQASDWLKDLLDEKQVYLEYDVAPEDKYGRMLAYVYLEDKKTMVNRLLLENGLARIIEVKPNTKYAEEFKEIENEAKKSKAGFWGTGFFY